MRATGERVFTARAGFNPTWQRHVAAYAAAAELLPPAGRVLDVGCGVGHSYQLLEPRETVGVDLDPAALGAQSRETHVADMRALPFPAASFASAVCVQAIEHVPDPQRALAEIVRVLEPAGMAVLVTPNRLTFARPEEIIDPYHYVEYDPAELRALCAPFFAQVRVLGLFGSARHQELFDAERRRLDRLLARDPLRLRRFVPRRARQRLYDRMLASARAKPDPRAAEITPEDFWLGENDLARSLDLVAVVTARG